MYKRDRLTKKKNIYVQKRSCEIREQHTFVDRFDERFDVPCLPKDERRDRIGGVTIRKRRRRRQRQRGVDGDAGGVVAPVLEAPQGIEEDLEYVTPLPADVVIQIGEYAAHSSFSPLVGLIFVTSRRSKRGRIGKVLGFVRVLYQCMYLRLKLEGER